MDPLSVRAGLLAGRSGISDIEVLETRHRGQFPVGEIKAETAALRQQLNGSPSPLALNRTAVLAALAARQAAEQARQVHRSARRVGLFSGTTVGGMDTTEDGYPEYLAGRRFAANFLETNDCGYATEYLADYLGNVHLFATSTTACSSSLNSIAAAVAMLRTGKLDVAIAGGTDGLCRFTINGFNSFMLLDQQACRPFDATRSGINLGEGAAFFVLETEESLHRSGNRPLAIIEGYANRNDTYHPTAISDAGRGIQLGMRGALHDAGLAADRIDYLITHGTATRNNDASEGAAIHQTFTNRVPAYASLKSTIGHTLGASGAINVGLGILAIQTDTRFANRNFSTSMPELTVDPVARNTSGAPVDYVMVNASGMGGFCTSLIISKA